MLWVWWLGLVRRVLGTVESDDHLTLRRRVGGEGEGPGRGIEPTPAHAALEAFRVDGYVHSLLPFERIDPPLTNHTCLHPLFSLLFLFQPVIGFFFRQRFVCKNTFHEFLGRKGVTGGLSFAAG